MVSDTNTTMVSVGLVEAMVAMEAMIMDSDILEEVEVLEDMAATMIISVQGNFEKYILKKSYKIIPIYYTYYNKESKSKNKMYKLSMKNINFCNRNYLLSYLVVLSGTDPASTSMKCYLYLFKGTT